MRPVYRIGSRHEAPLSGDGMSRVGATHGFSTEGSFFKRFISFFDNGYNPVYICRMNDIHHGVADNGQNMTINDV